MQAAIWGWPKLKTPILNLAGSITAPSTSAARYSAFAGGAAPTTWHSGINNAVGAFPVSGKLTKWRVKIDAAPGSGKSWLFELMLNGSADANFKITVADSDTEGTITLDRTLAAQDLVAIRLTPSGTPAAVTIVQSALLFEGDSSADSVIFGGTHSSVGISNSATTYFTPGCLDFSTSSRTRAMGVVASPGTIDRLHIYTNTAVLAGSHAFELYKTTDNGSNWTATGVTCTLSSGRLATDTTHSFTVARGDCFQLVSVPTGTPTSVEVRWSCRFIPDTVGESLLFGLSTDGANDTDPRYFNANGATSTAAGATESNAYNILPIAAVAKNLVTAFTTAPGSGKSRASTLRVNGSDSTLTNTISGTGTPPTASDTTHTVSLSDNDRIVIKSVPTSFPVSPGPMHFGMVLYIEPESTAPTLRMIYRKS